LSKDSLNLLAHGDVVYLIEKKHGFKFNAGFIAGMLRSVAKEAEPDIEAGENMVSLMGALAEMEDALRLRVEEVFLV
jgi:hypothetical protein